jgi:hypothetical protein
MVIRLVSISVDISWPRIQPSQVFSRDIRVTPRTSMIWSLWAAASLRE